MCMCKCMRLCKCLDCRFYEPQEGTIYFDGEDVRSMGVKDLRRRLAMVDQCPSLFAMSIIENVMVGNAKGRLSPNQLFSSSASEPTSM